mgnify:CR=1 FL=1
MSYTRFAVYYIPADGPLATFGTKWLGWDVARGCAVVQPDIAGLTDVTEAPRKYGFHATLKPPFRLAESRTEAQLTTAVSMMAAGCAAAQCDGLALTAMGRFLALTPQGDVSGIGRIAETCVQEIDQFRAAPDAAELKRRSKTRLSDRQQTMLRAWGYPYVMDQFRFHLTLTERVPKLAIPEWKAHAVAHLPALPAPFVLDAVALVGERSQDGRFELVQRFALDG